MRAAVYVRISRDDAGEQLGVQRQISDCRDLCTRRGWSVTEPYVDNDLSAYSGRPRPAYLRLLEDVRGGRVGAVVAWAPERLHRSPRELEDFIELIESSGIHVETVKAGAWDVASSHGRLVARMLGAVSRAESERIGERVSRAHRQAQGDGLWRGPIPYGLRASSAPGKPVPDPSQEAVVDDIFTRVLRGDALTAIATDLNAEGVLPRRGKAWTHTGIQRLLSSPALGGLVKVDGELRAAAFQGIVPVERWHAAQAALRRRPSGEKKRARQQLTLLGGLLTCAEHGHVCFGGSATHAPIYVAAGAGRCHVSISRTAADKLVRAVVVARLGAHDAAALLQPVQDHASTEKEINELRKRREDLAELLTEGLITGTEARPRLAELADRLAELHGSRVPSTLVPAEAMSPEVLWGELDDASAARSGSAPVLSDHAPACGSAKRTAR